MPVQLYDVAWADPRSVALRAAMDVEMGALYGDPAKPGPDSPFHIDPADIAASVLAVDDGVPVGHGALRRLHGELEVKRVIVAATHRGQGASYAIMAALEDRGRRLGASRLILHTGARQPAAIHVYERIGYAPIEVYPPYVDLPLSRCYAKTLA